MDPYFEKNARSVPGAGCYDPKPQTMNKTAPSFGFGTSTRKDRKASPVQDPGTYNPIFEFTKTKAAEYKLGTS